MNSKESLLKFLGAKSCFLKEDYIEKHKELIDMRHEDAFNKLLKEDLREWVDEGQLKAYCNLGQFGFGMKMFSLDGKKILAQVDGYANIAEPSAQQGSMAGEEDNLDVLEKTESKFLQGDEDIARKTERVSYKMSLTDGVNVFYAFEYENCSGEIEGVIKEEGVYRRKIFIGPGCEGRRGIFYLKKSNWRFAKDL